MTRKIHANDFSNSFDDRQDQIAYCLQVNCLGCKSNPGIYKNCPHFENKSNARNKKQNMQYKGYTATPLFSEQDNIFFGLVQGVSDLIAFEGSTIAELKESFEKAVDAYLDLCKRTGREPDKGDF